MSVAQQSPTFTNQYQGVRTVTVRNYIGILNVDVQEEGVDTTDVSLYGDQENVSFLHIAGDPELLIEDEPWYSIPPDNIPSENTPEINLVVPKKTSLFVDNCQVMLQVADTEGNVILVLPTSAHVELGKVSSLSVIALGSCDLAAREVVGATLHIVALRTGEFTIDDGQVNTAHFEVFGSAIVTYGGKADHVYSHVRDGLVCMTDDDIPAN